ncbi:MULTISPECIES: hypothetical protein [Streptomyces]|uniref:hypothetical protein n=1 Tax=Streptomyces TaxID=1883 RepID=UPI0019BA8A76|nr:MULTISPECIES: hypothetical protein [Streptomyces]GGT21005.1 hypothetical protein GCM10010286_53230 [Streptomyces toxytricini]
MKDHVTPDPDDFRSADEGTGSAGTNRSYGGLTTEELAQPHGGPDTGTGAPSYPGEAAPLAGSEEEDTTADTAEDTGTAGGTGTGARADTGADEADEADDAHDADRGGGQRLMPESEAADFRERWSRIQSDFVDDPRESVREADELVAAVMQHLAGTFASHKEELEKQWGSGEEVATEDLRLAFRRYRSFFDRLLTT